MYRIALPIVMVGSLLSAAADGEEKPGWQLVWSDEFDGSQLDYSKWGVEVNAFGGGKRRFSRRRASRVLAESFTVRSVRDPGLRPSG